MSASPLKALLRAPFGVVMREIHRKTVLRAVAASVLVFSPLFTAAPARAQSPDDPTPPPPAAAPPLGVSGSLSNSLVLRGNPGQATLLTVLSGSYQLTPAFSTFVRVGTVHNSSSDEASATGLANPALGLSYQLELGKHVKLGATSGVTLPIGSGGGNAPSAGAFRAWTNSIDWGGAMFAVDHVDVFNGVRGAFVYDRLTLQFESTVHELLRVRGEAVDPIGAAATVTGSTATVSYAVLPQLVLSTALAETRFWNTPALVQASPDSRVDYFFAAGISTVVKLGRLELDPGLVYARALDLPLRQQKFQVVEIDLGFAL